MDEFKNLLRVANVLIGPNGCPWDREQTLSTLQVYLLEESHELIEAIDELDPEKIKEELGDVLYTLIFIANLAEQKNLFTFRDAVEAVAQKLIRRHPHVFGETKIESTEDVLRNWEIIKKQEGKKSPFSGIPSTLPALLRTQKVISKLRRMQALKDRPSSLLSQEDLAIRLWNLVEEAESAGFDAESALRNFCKTREKNTGDGLMA